MPYQRVTNLNSEFEKGIIQSEDTNNMIRYWQSLLTSPKQQYSTALQQAETQRDYDISGAYANWKQAQLNLLQQSRLGTGVKSEINTSMKNQYETYYGQAYQNYFNTIGTAYTDYLKNLEAGEAELSNVSQQLTNMYGKMLEYSNLYYGTDYLTGEAGIEKMFLSEAEKGYGMFDYNAETGEFTPNTKFYQLADKLFGESITKPMTDKKGNVLDELQYSFSDWMAKQEGFEDVNKLFDMDASSLAKLLGGERIADLTYSEEEKMHDVLESDYRKRYYYDANKKFDSEKEEYDFYKQLGDAHKTISGKPWSKDRAKLMQKYSDTLYASSQKTSEQKLDTTWNMLQKYSKDEEMTKTLIKNILPDNVYMVDRESDVYKNNVILTLWSNKPIDSWSKNKNVKGYYVEEVGRKPRYYYRFYFTPSNTNDYDKYKELFNI